MHSTVSRFSRGCSSTFGVLKHFRRAALFIPLFLLNFRSLNQPWVISSWLAVAIVDPWLEEGYWRGLLTASGVFRFEARPRSLCRTALSPSFRSRFSNVRTQRTLSPNSTPACFWVMCRFLTSCSTFSRSRSFADIHSSSCDSAMSHQSGTFYLAQRGTSHVAATRVRNLLTPLDFPYK